MAQPAQQAPDDLAAGERFAERYQILGPLGRGGMGAVYHARDLSLGEEIALKLLTLSATASSVAVLRFRQEVKLSRRVTHPNVARVYDIGEHDGKLYLTMELVRGGTLRALIRRDRRVPLARALEIAQALAAGLAAAHEVGVIHRDLKPGNVLVDHDGRVVLTDFGIARTLDDEQALTTGLLGTPHYMAPEQLAGGMIDPRVDLYAFGLVLFEMLTGARAEGTREMLAESMRDAATPPSLIALTLRCLASDPDARPQSAREIGQVLAAIGGTDTTQAATLRMPSAARSGSTAERPTTSPETPASQALDPGADRAIAVLPFIFRGNKDHDHLGDVITDELVDVLCRTRSLRVLGAGATAKHRDTRDPRAIGRDLHVFAVIDGTVQMVGPRVRISVRLTDATTGVQLWSDAQEGTLEDLFRFQEAIARRVAEELRVEITTITRRGDAPAEAIEHYLTARRQLRHFDYEMIAAAVARFERCIELAPSFTPAFAGHAIACARAWFFDRSEGDPVDWGERARASVDRALERAGDIAESHLGAGMLATQRGDYRTAVIELHKALGIAPTYAEAHDYLGVLECEAGHGHAGERRLKLAADLSPELLNPLAVLARQYALHERHDEAKEALARLEQRGGSGPLLAGLNGVRVAAWRGDRETMAILARDGRFPGFKSSSAMRMYARAALGDLTEEEMERHSLAVVGDSRNARWITLAAQLAAEAFAFRGNMDAALRHLVRAADMVLLDLSWMDRCPLLAPLRPLPAFADARVTVEARATAIWNH